MKTQLTTTKTTTLALSKTKSLMGITAKILEGKWINVEKSNKTLTKHDTIVIDGLTWMKAMTAADFEYAMELIEIFKEEGSGSWRLPTIKELENIVTLCGGEVTCCTGVDLSDVQIKNSENEEYLNAYERMGFDLYGTFLSSTKVINDESRVWTLYGHFGYSCNRYGKNKVYTVRFVQDLA